MIVSSMKLSVVEKISAYATGLLALVCVVVPFHAFLTVWAGASFGSYTVWRAWPEILLGVLVVLAVVVVWRRPEQFKVLRRDPLLACIGAYAALHVAIGLWALVAQRVNLIALLDGLVLNLRPVLFLAVGWIVGLQNGWLHQNWRKVLIVPATVVVVFGLLQIFVLPPDFLRHFGYGPVTIPAYETVDQKLDYVRVQSTLRGANPLGAYVVVALVALAAVGWRRRTTWIKGLLAADVVGAIVVLMYTYSRSAYLGAATALGVFAWLSIKNHRMKQYLVLGATTVLLFGAGVTITLRNNDHIQNTFFHTDEHSQSAHSSNQDRSSALQNGLRDMVHQPLGTGPGTAGPASVHNNHTVRLAENYFLQIGQEVGWLGLGLFVVISLLVAAKLWAQKTDPLARLLLASLVGITLVNMLSHAWTDETLAIIWWSLAGVALARKWRSQ